MTFYSTKRSTDRTGKTVTTDKYGDQVAMEYQYYLFCANSVKNEANNAFDAVEWGTVEGGKLERKVWDHTKNMSL